MNEAVNVILFEGGSPIGEIEKMLVKVKYLVQK
jgi:hypothetical protein